jgi:hypothetical protein
MNIDDAKIKLGLLLIDVGVQLLTNNKNLEFTICDTCKESTYNYKTYSQILGPLAGTDFFDTEDVGYICKECKKQLRTEERKKWENYSYC